MNRRQLLTSAFAAALSPAVAPKAGLIDYDLESFGNPLMAITGNGSLATPRIYSPEELAMIEKAWACSPSDQRRPRYLNMTGFPQRPPILEFV